MKSIPFDLWPYDNDCPMYHLLDILWKKWMLFVIIILYENVQTFNSLSKKLIKINSKVLSERLDVLVWEGYVKRKVTEVKPLKITYELSDEWKELASRIIEIGLWKRSKLLK